MMEADQFTKQPSPSISDRTGSFVEEDGTRDRDGLLAMKSTEAPEKAAIGGGGLFTDVEQMKDKLRKNMTKPAYDVSDFYVKSGIFQHIARHKIFEAATLSVIAFNALWISIDTDHNKAEMLLGATPVFQIAEHFFCFYFSFEWFARYMSFKRKRDGLKDAWFVFDSIMVFMMVMETWVMTCILLASGAGGGGGLGNASILRLARLLRLSRMARMARLLRAMPELLILIKGMVAAMRSVCFTLMLLAVIVYVFGIMFTQLTVETYVGETYFRTVPLSMHTLLLDGALMDGVGQVVKDLGDESLVFAAIFYIFVLLASLTMMNMLIGVLCEVVSAVATTEREEITVSYVKEKLQEVVSASGLDADGDGLISREEFKKIIEIPDAVNTLTDVGIDVVGLVDLSDFIFEGADDEDGDKTLSFIDFLEIILQLRGSNTATVKDIVDLRKFVRTSNKSLENKLEAVMKGERRRMSKVPTQPGKLQIQGGGGRRPSVSGHEMPNSARSGQQPVNGNVVGNVVIGNVISGNGLSDAPSIYDDFAKLKANGQGSLDCNHKNEEKLWVRAGKLEELLLAVQTELGTFTDAMGGMMGLSPNRHHVLQSRPSSSGHFSNGSTNDSDGSPNAWEGENRPEAPPHVRVPGIPDSVLPPTTTTPSNSDQYEDLRRQLGSLEQSLLESMGGLHSIRTKLGGFQRFPDENGSRPETRRPNL